FFPHHLYPLNVSLEKCIDHLWIILREGSIHTDGGVDVAELERTDIDQLLEAHTLRFQRGRRRKCGRIDDALFQSTQLWNGTAEVNCVDIFANGQTKLFSGHDGSEINGTTFCIQ